MLSLRRPQGSQISLFLDRLAGSSLSYGPVGLSQASPRRFNVDEMRVRLGEGEELFERAKHALDAWRMFELDWAELLPRNPESSVGTNVAVLGRVARLWTMNGCRVVSRIDSAGRYGFAYGTLREHAERGEECFTVELDPTDEAVWYMIRAVSRPRAILAIVGYPLSRRMQRKFREDSAAALRAAIA